MRKYQLIIVLALMLLVGWACSKDAGVSPTTTDTGKGGSLARFAIVGNFMYAVSDWELKIYNISTPSAPQFVATQRVGWSIETMFAYGKNLFLGARNGIYLYEIQSDGSVVQKSFYRHFNTCDPVVAEGQFAYSTIRSGVACRALDTLNQLEILDVSDINNPKSLSVVKMTFPIGLGIDGDNLFVCDKEGLRILNVADRKNPKEIHYMKGIDAIDVIVLDKHLLIIGKEKLTQISYKNIANPTVVSTLDLK
jgi:LVIVD repeat